MICPACLQDIDPVEAEFAVDTDYGPIHSYCTDLPLHDAVHTNEQGQRHGVEFKAVNPSSIPQRQADRYKHLLGLS